MIHPDDYDLIRFAKSKSPADAESIRRHAEDCASCAEQLALIREWVNTPDSFFPDSSDAQFIESLAKASAYHQLRTIPLFPFESAVRQHTYALAADGASVSTTNLQHRATLYSENPEVVLRIMHDPATRLDRLQLTAADVSHTRGVYIHLVDPPLDILTDDHGTAEIASDTIRDPAGLAWQIKLPDATFALQEFSFPLSRPETIIESPEGHRAAVSIESGAGGFTLRIRPISLYGASSEEKLRLVVSQSGGQWSAFESALNKESIVTNLQAGAPVELRLFMLD